MAIDKLKNFIAEKWVEAQTGHSEEVIDPACGEVLARVPLSSGADVDKAVKSAGEAFAQWHNTPPPAQAKAFWSYIHKINPYKNWQMWPGKHGLYPGRSPHGAFLKLYVNKIAYTAAKTHRPMPGGAILVKENYAKDKTTLLTITPMHKTDQYNPSAGNWFWAKYGPEGKAMETGKIQSCIDCHRTAKNFIFTPSH